MKSLSDQAGTRRGLVLDPTNRGRVDAEALRGKAQPCPPHVHGAGDQCRRPDAPGFEQQGGFLGIFRGAAGQAFFDDSFGWYAEFTRHFSHGYRTDGPPGPPRAPTDDEKGLAIPLMKFAGMPETSTTSGVQFAGGTNPPAQDDNRGLRTQVRGEPEGARE